MPITSKQRSQLRGLAAAEDTIIQVGKGGINDNLIESVRQALTARELVKGRVLENSMLTAREACDALCEAVRAEGVQCIGSKFVIYKKSEKKAQEAAKQARAERKKAANPVRRGAQERRRKAKEAREKRNEYFRQSAIQAAIERRNGKNK